MDTLQENIRGLPVELRERIYRELVKIQVQRKEPLHPLCHRRLNHWYLNAIRGLILEKVFKWSDIDQLFKKNSVDCLVDSNYFYYQVHLLNRIPEEQRESYQTFVRDKYLAEDEDETSGQILICQLVVRKFRFDNGIIRPVLCRKFTYSCRKKRL
jgi:hypothetical protein